MKFKNITLGLMITGIFAFSGCDLQNDNYRYETTHHGKYKKILETNPDFKVNVKDLNLQKEIDDDTIFCYSTVDTLKDKMKKLVEGIRSEIPLDCNGGVETSGGYECLLENDLLDVVAKENSINQANNQVSDLKELAQENGYSASIVEGDSLVQRDLSEAAMIKMLENKMKQDANFCSYIIDKRVKDLGVDYYESNGNRYWTIVLGNKQ